VQVVIGNAAPVQDRRTGRILVPFCRNNLQVLLTYSDDDGRTWSPAVNLTGVTMPAWKWVGTGPPAGVQLSGASGRLLIPSYHSEVPNDDGEFSIDHVMVSDDGGATWSLGGNFSYGAQFPNECQAVAFPDGSVYINSRGLWNDRVEAWSTDGGDTWPPDRVKIIADLKQPLEGCEGSTVRHPTSGLLFYSGPIDSSWVRYNSTCRSAMHDLPSESGLSFSTLTSSLLVLPHSRCQCLCT
jgi:sialidase-1